MASVRNFPTPSVSSSGTLSTALQARREYLQSELLDLILKMPTPRLLCMGINAVSDLEQIIPRITGNGGEVLVYEGNEQRADAFSEERSVNGLELVPCRAWPLQSRDFGKFDYIYAPNLLNSLSDASSKRCLAQLAPLLTRRGKLLLSNLTPDFYDSEYFPKPAYVRKEEQIASLTENIPDACFTGQMVWRDPSSLLVFLEVHR